MEINRDREMVGYSGPQHGKLGKPDTVFGLDGVGTGDHGSVLGRGMICKNLVKARLLLEIIPMTSAPFKQSFARCLLLYFACKNLVNLF